MITFNKHPKNNKSSLKETLATTGAIAVAAAGGLAAPAAAQSGGTEAPVATAVTAPNQAGGAEAPSMPEADQALNLQAQQAVAVLSERFAKFQASHPANSTKVQHMKDGQGNQLASTTTTVPVKGLNGHGEGQYSFNVVSDIASGEVYSLTASEGPAGDSQPPYASVTFEQNPRTNTWEAGGTYKLPGASTAGNENYVSRAAGIESVASNMVYLDADDISANALQIKNMYTDAEQKKPAHLLEPAFNAQGSTINGPEN